MAIIEQKVKRVLIDQDVSPPSAQGAESGSQGQKFVIYAKHEALLTAGALASPLILEYSGIGLKKVLNAAGVPEQIVDLPVGLNLQDQTTMTLMADIHTDGTVQGQAAYFATVGELFNAQDNETARGLLHSQLNQWAADSVAKAGFENQTTLRKQSEIHRRWILDDNVAYAELFMYVHPFGSVSVWVLLPFTRGYAHIMSSDPVSGKNHDKPEIPGQ
ncbi:hypothetical protein PENDEC_c007G03515 [Penicillium decumbens]|uniref:Glucose-methanol-choline oxidoreductase N-terminal domain-containing protein n=1 Tax=Penicillium decumbens TaxID=69771 RepID=A0A1V6PEB9_PENDC|nr:hypothetical protein PENDEC_c007G03515 [Penicillium decumbens]